MKSRPALPALHKILGVAGLASFATVYATPSSVAASDVYYDGYVCSVEAYNHEYNELSSAPYVTLYSAPGCSGSYIDGASTVGTFEYPETPVQADRLHTVATSAAATDSRVTGYIGIRHFGNYEIARIKRMKIWAN